MFNLKYFNNCVSNLYKLYNNIFIRFDIRKIYLEISNCSLLFYLDNIDIIL